MIGGVSLYQLLSSDVVAFLILSVTFLVIAFKIKQITIIIDKDDAKRNT